MRWLAAIDARKQLLSVGSGKHRRGHEAIKRSIQGRRPATRRVVDAWLVCHGPRPVAQAHRMPPVAGALQPSMNRGTRQQS